MFVLGCQIGTILFDVMMINQNLLVLSLTGAGCADALTLYACVPSSCQVWHRCSAVLASRHCRLLFSDIYFLLGCVHSELGRVKRYNHVCAMLSSLRMDQSAEPP